MKKKEVKMGNKPAFDLNSECVNYTNISQGIIHITEDKLKVILFQHKNKNFQFYSWTTPFGIFTSCLFATITSNFENTWGIPSTTWQAIFIISTAVTGIWSLCAVINAIKNRKGREIDDLIETIKNDSKSKV